MSPSSQKTPRQDVQGLRTIGALLVAIFHIWEAGISGGVDVFFVVSGYFLGVGYAQHLARQQQVRAADHFGRFVRRTVPQVFLVLIAILVMGFLLASPLYWRPLLRELVLSALYLQNYGLIRAGQDYLARDEAASLVQHFWAVSLIAQAYILWYPLTRIADGIARWQDWTRLRVLTVLLCSLIVLSFVWSVIWTGRNPTAAYFDLLTRYWQFGAGAVLGLWFSGPQRMALPKSLSTPLSWIGLGLIVTCGVLIGGTAAFPGYAALWPVAGAALILVASEEGARHNAGRLLATRPLAALGTYSFGIYLWHWPLYVLVLQFTGQTPSLVMGASIIAASILLAVLSQKLADATVASAQGWVQPGVVAMVCVAALCGLAGLSYVGHSTLGPERQRSEANQYITFLQQLPWISEGFGRVTPGVFEVRSDMRGGLLHTCGQNIIASEVLHCDYGNLDSDEIVFLVGGSHSGHWLPALDGVAKDHNWRLVSITKAACPFASPKDDAFFIAAEYHESCRTWNNAVIDKILTERPKLVLTLATRSKFTDPHLRRATVFLGEDVPLGYLMHFQTLAEAGIQVIAIRDTPRLGHDVPTCVFAHRFVDPATCGSARSEMLGDQTLPAEIAKLPQGLAFVDMTDAFCDDSYCDVVRDGIVMFRDRNHLTATYARHIGPLLGERIDAAMSLASARR